IAALANENHAKIVDGLRIVRAKCDRLLDEAFRLAGISLPRVKHAEAVVRFGIFGLELERAREVLQSSWSLSLTTQGVTEIEQGRHIVRALRERTFKVLDRLVRFILLAGNHSQIVPGFGIVGSK